jgi:hypothetical protein
MVLLPNHPCSQSIVPSTSTVSLAVLHISTTLIVPVANKYLDRLVANSIIAHKKEMAMTKGLPDRLPTVADLRANKRRRDGNCIPFVHPSASPDNSRLVFEKKNQLDPDPKKKKTKHPSVVHDEDSHSNS